VSVDWEALKLEHDTVIRVTLGDRELGFRPLRPDEAERLVARFERCPARAIDIAFEACRDCCVAGAESLDELADQYPLAFSAETGICERLLQLASDHVASEIKQAIRSWRGAERQLGKMAQSLLAFKAYQGGPPSAEVLAGALHLAELIDTVKGTYKLHVSFMRALGKRKG
jgi:hypothetical protein